MSKKNNETNYNSIKANDNMVVDDNNEEVKNKRKTLDKVIDIQPKKVKRNLGSRLVHGILVPEGLPGIGSYVSEEIIVPAIKNIIVDAVTSGINMVMYGESKGQGPRHYGRTPYNSYGSSPRPTTNYTSRYTSTQPEPSTVRPRSVRQGVEEYIIENREDAAHVLTTLTEQADMYGSVSVADYYDLIGIHSDYTDNNYGWLLDTIVHSTIRPVRGGFIIKFAPAEVI